MGAPPPPSERRGRHAASASKESSPAVPGRPRRARHDRRARPRPRRGDRPRPGMRRVPHRPALPRGRDQPGLPVPARARGVRHRRGGRGRASPTSQPGDFVILNWRAVCGNCRACLRGQPQYCFATHNASQRMRLEDGTELSPALGIGAFAEKTLVHAGQCTKVDPAAAPAVAGLLGCGVMAGLGAAHQHRRRHPRRLGRRDRMRRRGSGRHRRGRASPVRRGSSPSTSTPASSPRRASSAPRTRSTHARSTSSRRSASSRTASAPTSSSTRSARPQTWTQAFYARDLAGTVVLVGVPTPEMTHRPAAPRRLRPRRIAEVELVRRLPAQPRLPDADRPLPAGAPPPRALRVGGDRPRRGRGGLHQDARTATCCAPSWCCDVGCASTTRSRRGRSRSTAQTFDVDNNVWVVGDDDECIVIDAPHDVDAILDLVGGPPRRRDRLHARARRPRPRGTRSWPPRRGHRCCSTRTTRRVWALTHPEYAAGREPWPTAR